MAMQVWSWGSASDRDAWSAKLDELAGCGQCENPSCGGSARRFVYGVEVPIDPCPNAPEPPHTMIKPSGTAFHYDHPEGYRFGAIIDDSLLALAASANQQPGIVPPNAMLTEEEARAAGWFGPQ